MSTSLDSAVFKVIGTGKIEVTREPDGTYSPSWGLDEYQRVTNRY